MKYSFLFLFTVAFCACQNTNDSKASNETVTKETETLSAFEQELDSLYKLGVFNGFAVAVVDSNGIRYNQGFGLADIAQQKPYTEQTVINIASISKSFIGLALMKAQQMGLLNLDDPINQHLPFKVINPHYPSEEITIRQLATHTSSIVDTDEYMATCYINLNEVDIDENLKEKYGTYYQNPPSDYLPLAKYLQKILQKGEAFYVDSTFAVRKPGSLREYSNIGAALCALVIESASQQKFDAFTKSHIFEPLQMMATTWRFEEADINQYAKLYYDEQLLPYYKILSYPDGGLITSSHDLGLFLSELIKGYQQNGSLLSAESYQELFRSQLEASALDREDFNVGLFLQKELPYHVIGHTGGDPGTNTMMFFDTETGIGRIFITNTDSKKENSKEVMWGIWNALEKFE